MGCLKKLTLLLVLLLVGATQAWAEFRLIPGITLREEYDDNINLDAENEEDDFITTISPQLSLIWQTKYVDLDLNANVNFKYYLDSGDTETDAGDASTLKAVFDLYRGVFFLSVTDTYARVTIDEGRRSSEDNSRVNQTDSNRLTINPYLQFVPLSDLQVRLGYSYENLWYEEEEGDDAESHAFSLILTKPLSERVTLALSGAHLEYRPKSVAEVFLPDEEGNFEYDQDTVRLGLSYQLSERLQIEGGYGHSWLDYDVREDSDSETWDVRADYVLSSSLKTGITYNLGYSVSVEDGPSEQRKLSAYLGYDDRIQVMLSAFRTEEKYVEIDREDDSFGGALDGSVPFTDKYGLTWGLHYTNYDESGLEAQHYDRYRTRLAFYYNLRMGQLSAGWTWTRNESDLDEEDYTNNILYLQASLTF